MREPDNLQFALIVFVGLLKGLLELLGRAKGTVTDDYDQDRPLLSLIIPLSHRVTLESYYHRVTKVGKDQQVLPLQPARPSQLQNMAVPGYSCNRGLFLLLQGHYSFPI